MEINNSKYVLGSLIAITNNNSLQRVGSWVLEKNKFVLIILILNLDLFCKMLLTYS